MKRNCGTKHIKTYETKAVLRTFIMINAFIKKKERPQIISHLKELEKERSSPKHTKKGNKKDQSRNK